MLHEVIAGHQAYSHREVDRNIGHPILHLAKTTRGTARYEITNSLRSALREEQMSAKKFVRKGRDNCTTYLFILLKKILNMYSAMLKIVNHSVLPRCCQPHSQGGGGGGMAHAPFHEKKDIREASPSPPHFKFILSILILG